MTEILEVTAPGVLSRIRGESRPNWIHMDVAYERQQVGVAAYQDGAVASLEEMPRGIQSMLKPPSVAARNGQSSTSAAAAVAGRQLVRSRMTR